MTSSQPNDSHFALSTFEALSDTSSPSPSLSEKQLKWLGLSATQIPRFSVSPSLSGIVTQNVDGLHIQAGSKNVVELHGNLLTVSCLNCGHKSPRSHLQNQLLFHNHQTLQLAQQHQDGPDAKKDQGEKQARPDGDMDLEISADIIKQLKVPSCSACGTGTLMPDVVFFGGTVPKHVTQRASEIIEEADGVFVMGTTLPVQSSLRLVTMASKRNVPILIVNDGPTRADDLEHVIKIEDRLFPLISDSLRSYLLSL